MSTLKTNNIQHVDRSDPSIIINTDGSVNIAGTMTYEDVTNVDAVGIITGRNNIDAQKQVLVGTGVSVKAGGLNVTAGITTVQALQATTGTFSAAVSGTTGTFSAAVSGTTGTFSAAVSGTTGTFSGDVSIADKIIHTGDTNTAIRFPAADTITAETGGSERVRITSTGVVGINTVGARGATLEIQDLGSTGPCLLLAGATNTEGDLVVPDGQDFNIGHWNNVDTFTERLRITSTGLVGIGTVPETNANLHVMGSSRGRVIVHSGGSESAQLWLRNPKRTWKIHNYYDQDSLIFTDDSDTRLTINADGNTNFVGIVTATEFIPTETQLSHRNRIINGNMRISQRATTSSSNGIKTVDRWDTTASGMDQLAFTQKRVTDSPNIHAYSYEVDITTAESAQAGDEYMRVQQKIEAQDLQYLAWGTSDAKTVTVSFWVKAYQTGTYTVNFYRQDANRQITRTYTINASATWEYKSVTIPGDTGGSGINNDTGAGIHLAFILIADSGYRTTDSTSWIDYTDGGFGYGQGVNLGSSTNNYWKITGVQFEQGSQPTPYENQKFDDILFACQRYYCELGRRINFDGTAATGDSKYSFIGLQAYSTSNLFGTLANFPRKMRAKPTVTTIGHIKYSNKQGGNIYAPNTSSYGAITHETVGTTGIAFDTAHFIQGGFACGFTDNDNAAYNYIKADAEI